MTSSFARYVLAGIVLLAAASRIGLLFRSDVSFSSRPFIEDAYYSLAAAKHLAEGRGISVDGMSPTNGVQPLIVFLYAPAFFTGSDPLALRLCLLLDILIEAALALVLFRLVGRMWKGKGDENAPVVAGISAVFLYYFSYAVSVSTLNGLETALAPLLVLTALMQFRRRFAPEETAVQTGPSLFLGALLGLAILARIDTAFFAVALGLLHLFNRASKATAAVRIMRVALWAVAAATVSSLWWWYNVSQFGSLVPTSGLSQSLVVPYGENLTALLQGVLNAFLVIGYLPYTRTLLPYHYAMIILWLGIALGASAITKVRRPIADAMHELRGQYDFGFLVPVFVYCLLLAAYYVLGFGAPHFMKRYLFIAQLLIVVFSGIVAEYVFRKVSFFWKRAARAAAVLAAFVVLLVYVLPYSWNYSETKARSNDFLMISEWIRTHTSDEQRVGMGQSGTSGFFNRNVTNLDGKVNAGAFAALKSGGFCRYVENQDFDYLIDWPEFFVKLEPCGMMNRYVLIDSVGRFFIYARTGQMVGKRLIAPTDE